MTLKNKNNTEYLRTMLLIIIILFMMASAFFSYEKYKSDKQIWDAQIKFDTNTIKILQFQDERIEKLERDILLLNEKIILLESKLNESVNT